MRELMGMLLREVRKSKCLSQNELANLSKTDITYISRVTFGKQNITIEFLNVLYICLIISLREFFGCEDFEKIEGGSKWNQ